MCALLLNLRRFIPVKMSCSEEQASDSLLGERKVCLELVKKEGIWVEGFNDDRTNSYLKHV